MENRASHIMIGTFVLLLAGALFGFVIWLSRASGGATNDYDVIFEDSVAGLAAGGVVRFNGVPVGAVEKIALVPDDPRSVRVRIKVDADVPVLQGAFAMLEAQGLTGVAFVQLSGGRKGAPVLEEAGPYGAPVIPSRASAIQKLFLDAPRLLEQAQITLLRLGEVLDERNREALASTLQNVKTVTGTFARRSPELDRTIVNFEQTVKDYRSAAATLERAADRFDLLVDNEGRAAVAEFRATLVNSNIAIDQLDKALIQAQPGISQFSDATVPELNRLLVDMRQLMQSLNRVAEHIESNPAALLTGNQAPEYDAPRK